jgi:hypothetical protein
MDVKNGWWADGRGSWCESSIEAAQVLDRKMAQSSTAADGRGRWPQSSIEAAQVLDRKMAQSSTPAVEVHGSTRSFAAPAFCPTTAVDCPEKLRPFIAKMFESAAQTGKLEDLLLDVPSVDCPEKLRLFIAKTFESAAKTGKLEDSLLDVFGTGMPTGKLGVADVNRMLPLVEKQDQQPSAGEGAEEWARVRASTRQLLIAACSEGTLKAALTTATREGDATFPDAARVHTQQECEDSSADAVRARAQQLL